MYFYIPYTIPRNRQERKYMFDTIRSALYSGFPSLIDDEMMSVWHLPTHNFSQEVISQVVGKNGENIYGMTQKYFPGVVFIYHNIPNKCFDIHGFDRTSILKVKDIIQNKLSRFSNCVVEEDQLVAESSKVSVSTEFVEPAIVEEVADRSVERTSECSSFTDLCDEKSQCNTNEFSMVDYMKFLEDPQPPLPKDWPTGLKEISINPDNLFEIERENFVLAIEENYYFHHIALVTHIMETADCTLQKAASLTIDILTPMSNTPETHKNNCLDLCEIWISHQTQGEERVHHLTPLDVIIEFAKTLWLDQLNILELYLETKLYPILNKLEFETVKCPEITVFKADTMKILNQIAVSKQYIQPKTEMVTHSKEGNEEKKVEEESPKSVKVVKKCCLKKKKSVINKLKMNGKKASLAWSELDDEWDGETEKIFGQETKINPVDANKLVKKQRNVDW